MEYHKLQSLLIVLCMVCSLMGMIPVSASEADIELIVNGGFEEGQVGWSSDVWETSAFILEDGSAEGSRHLQFSEKNGEWPNVNQVVAVETNTDYILRFKFKFIEGGQWSAYVKIADGDTEIVKVDPDLTQTEWHDYEVEFNSGGYNSLTLFIGGSGSTFEMDEVSITKKIKEPQPGEEGELIVNGGFEEGQVGWESGYWSTGIASIIENGTSPEGQRHLKLASNSEDWYSVTQTMAVEPNETYDVFFKANVTAATEIWDVFLKVAWDDGGNWVDLQEAFNPSNTQSGWQDYSFSFSSGEHTELTLFIGGHASTWEIDAVRVEKKIQSPEQDYDLYVPMPKNLLSNSSFEDGQSGWSSNNWESGIATILDSSEVDPSPDGAKHLYFSDDVDGTWFSISQTIAVERNTTYEVTFQCRVLSSSTTWGVYSKLTDASGADLQEAYNPDINKPGWQDCSYTFQSGDNVALTFYMGGNVSSFEVDNIQIRQASGLVVSINESRRAVHTDGAYVLTGNTSKACTLVVTVNGIMLPETATTGKDHVFSVPLTLLGGRNVITVTASAAPNLGETISFDLYGQQVMVSNVQQTGNFLPNSAFGAIMEVTNLTEELRNVTVILTVHDENITLKYITYAQVELGGNATETIELGTDCLPLTDATGCSVQVRLVDGWNTLIPYPQKGPIWPEIEE